MIQAVEFQSTGATLRGRLYLPDAAARKPALVVMANGTSATLSMATDGYAEVFCRAGLAVLLYDHRNFGASGGEPRQEINPWIQARGYRDAVAFAGGLDGVDGARIALWGSSFAGGLVFVVGALEARVKAIVAQVPGFGAEPPPCAPSREVLERLRDIFANGDVRGSAAETTGPLPVVSADQAATPSLLKPIQAFHWFSEYGGRAGSGWINRATRVIPATPVPFHPGLCAPFVTAPTLLMVAPQDEMVHANYAVVRAAYDLIPGTKQWHEIAGGHFGLLYCPGALFDEASGVQAEFLGRWL